jgi:la-related protein 1
MDSEGWIDISMIASFNRVRSLTPDVDVVRDVMEMSVYLDVRKDKVRLANGEAKRWVLPDAKVSIFAPSPRARDAELGAGAATATSSAASESAADAASVVEGDEQQQHTPAASYGLSVGQGVGAAVEESEERWERDLAADVESALMKNSGSWGTGAGAGAGSAGSAGAGVGVKGEEGSGPGPQREARDAKEVVMGLGLQVPTAPVQVKQGEESNEGKDGKDAPTVSAQ